MSHSSRHSYPIFARVFARRSRGEEKYGVREFRRELLSGLAGRVIEVGAGNGLDFPYYPDTVREPVTEEPEPRLRRLGEQAARAAPVPVRVVDGTAEALPFADGSFDAAIASLVLCSVAHQEQALRELRRMLKPDGESRFYAHAAAETPGLLRLQQVLDLVWPHLSGGCHTARDTVAAIERAGFWIERCRRFSIRPCVLAAPTSPQVLAVARNDGTGP